MSHELNSRHFIFKLCQAPILSHNVIKYYIYHRRDIDSNVKYYEGYIELNQSRYETFMNRNIGEGSYYTRTTGISRNDTIKDIRNIAQRDQLYLFESGKNEGRGYRRDIYGTQIISNTNQINSTVPLPSAVFPIPSLISSASILNCTQLDLINNLIIDANPSTLIESVPNNTHPENNLINGKINSILVVAIKDLKLLLETDKQLTDFSRQSILEIINKLETS